MDWKSVVLGCSLILASHEIFAQGCCSGGSGSPIAGGTSQGVLQSGQTELALSHQFFNTGRFFYGDRDSVSTTIRELQSSYLYFRIAYGLSPKLTFSVESGYFIHKTEYGFNTNAIDYKRSSGGIADLILFPRYNVWDRSTERYHSELTLGLGIKIPLGSCNDSTFAGSVTIPGQAPLHIYYTSPPTIQATTGSTDAIFYGFAAHEFKKAKFKVFANALYMHKGFNQLGQKFGDYLGMAVFASKTYKRKLGMIIQFRYEWVDRMQAANQVDLLALYNVDVNSTGSRKLSAIPQLSYTYKNFNFFGMYEYPLYQYMQGFQIGVREIITTGISYRFQIRKSLWSSEPTDKK